MDVEIKSCRKSFTKEERKNIIEENYNPLKVKYENNLPKGGNIYE